MYVYSAIQPDTILQHKGMHISIGTLFARLDMLDRVIEALTNSTMHSNPLFLEVCPIGDLETLVRAYELEHDFESDVDPQATRDAISTCKDLTQTLTDVVTSFFADR